MIEILRQQFHDLLGGWNAIGLLTREQVDWRLLALLLFAVVIATTVHEFGHAWMADRLGDATPRSQGRVSLSPLAHIDPLGFTLLVVTMFIGFPVGWGRPVRTNPENYTCGERLGTILVALAGPLMNLLTAIVLAPLARYVLAGGIGNDESAVWILFALAITMVINIALFAFNLVPVHPLDGSHIAASVLPEPLSKPYRIFMRKYGVYLLLYLMITGTLGRFIAPVVITLFRLLMGL